MNTISSMKVPGLTEDKCVTLIGMAGAGKSTVGRELARRLGVHAGADVRLAFTKIGNGFWAVRLK